MGLSTAEKNRRKRDRKKKEREEKRKHVDNVNKEESETPAEDDVEIEYVAEKPALPDDEAFASLRRFQERASVIISDDELNGGTMQTSMNQTNEDLGIDEDGKYISKRKLREMIRPSVADLKRRVARPDLVEAHDITAADPDFLIELKGARGTVTVPRHWGRKRKYLQGKRGFEKPPFKLPEFITATGIAELRDTVAEAEANMSVKRKNRQRVAPKMGAIDVDYRTLHDAFFKHQTKPSNLARFGDLYYEGKELETKTKIKPGAPLSKALREALGMTSETSPPPWLINMQRYGPPPSYPGLKIPGLNAPLPSESCQYGYHPGGWGKPPVDAYGRPLYGGNPFDPPGSAARIQDSNAVLITNDGKTLGKSGWGSLPTGMVEEEESEEEHSEDEMEESEEEEEENEEMKGGVESVLPPPPGLSIASAPIELRKQAGDETPLTQSGPKQLYQVIEQKKTSSDDQSGVVFTSEYAYVLPGQQADLSGGAESVLAKAAPAESNNNKRKAAEDDDDELDKNFKF